MSKGEIPAESAIEPGSVLMEYLKNETIFDEAKDIIYGDREKTHGRSDKNLKQIARFWNDYLQGKYLLAANLSYEDVCWMMVLLKVSRAMNAQEKDHRRDAIGYIGLIDKIIDETANEELRPAMQTRK